ncbi:hypothetical protein RND81_09G220600 [Saponaria officinalis]|uniref:Kinesin motor domain-containing protein n=1 Tax=Saponaria officinalis TaxID=3572 RepID=A0AAW1IP17_SAPOF
MGVVIFSYAMFYVFVFIDNAEEIVRLRSKQKKFDEKRRNLLNKILDIKGSIRVFCRIRPLPWNNNRKTEAPILIDSDKVVVKSAGIKKEFDFDKVFCQNSTQEDVFVEVEPILRSALDGHNVCVLAYGQTGTGKTFTMEGTTDQLGIVPRALKELFRQASVETTKSITFSMSMLEVYMGNLKDLLAPRPTRRVYEPITRCNLNIQADSKGVVDIEGLTEVPISDFSKARWWYAKGRRARATSSTSVNEASSRSHCLTRITICHHGDPSEGEVRTSKLWMVDLGGSERLLKTGATGLTLDEGRAINLSLSALADVVASLRRRRPHVPYRNSKLTQILRDSLGNDSKVLMIVHISSIAEDLGETICSMSFAKRARAIESNHELAEDLKNHRQKKIDEHNEEMKEIEEECQTIRNQLQKAEFLLRENNRVHSDNNGQEVDEDNTPESTKNDRDVDNNPLDNTEKTSRRKSLPHFMISTAASRAQRQSPAEHHHFTAKVLRSGTRSSMPLSASQSLSFMEPRLKAVLRNGNKTHHDKLVNNIVVDTQNHHTVEPNSCSTPRSKSVTPSYPTNRPLLPYHKRRVSSLI